jgi:exodeoxyribonuclease III
MSALQAARLKWRKAAIAQRALMSPTGPAPERLRLATWNLNSLRARLGAVDRFIERAYPDVLCLQETKTSQLSEPALSTLERHGYTAVHVGGRSYNGVAVAARHPISDVRASGNLGDEHLDREPRIITCLVDTPVPVRVASVYVPHGRAVDHWHYEFKVGFLHALAEWARQWLLDDTHLLVAGDVNVAATDSDVFHPDAFDGSVYTTPPVRDALARLLDAGLTDADVAQWGPRARRFTWWDLGMGYARNLGMRLDVIAVDRALAARLETTWIDHVERSLPRPSDHAALVADFHLSDDRIDRRVRRKV